MFSNLPLFLIVVLFGSPIGGLANRPTAAPHILEDGFVERSLSIVVRNSTAYGEYRIGLNNNTMTELVSDWTRDSKEPSSDSTNKSELENTAASRNSKSNTAAETTSTQPPKQNVVANKLESQKARLNSQPTIKQEAGPSESRKGAQPESKNPISEKENHWLDPSILKQLETLSHARIKEHLKVRIAEQIVAIQAIEAGPPPRHPFYLSIKFQFSVPDSGSFDLEINDKVFHQDSGAVRYALKTQGKPMILKSNVAPAIVRSKRVELGELTPQQREAETCISVRIGVASRGGREK